jgi:hypothetical protein
VNTFKPYERSHTSIVGYQGLAPRRLADLGLRGAPIQPNITVIPYRDAVSLVSGVKSEIPFFGDLFTALNRKSLHLLPKTGSVSPSQNQILRLLLTGVHIRHRIVTRFFVDRTLLVEEGRALIVKSKPDVCNLFGNEVGMAGSIDGSVNLGPRRHEPDKYWFRNVVSECQEILRRVSGVAIDMTDGIRRMTM